MNWSNTLKVASWLAVLAYAAIIFWISSSSNAEGLGNFFDLNPPYDKVFHALGYAVFGLILRLATGKFWLAVLLASLYGASDELHQLTVSERDASVFDWMADTLGASVGALVAAGVVEFLTKRHQKRVKTLE